MTFCVSIYGVAIKICELAKMRPWVQKWSEHGVLCPQIGVSYFREKCFASFGTCVADILCPQNGVSYFREKCFAIFGTCVADILCPQNGVSFFLKTRGAIFGTCWWWFSCQRWFSCQTHFDRRRLRRHWNHQIHTMTDDSDTV